MTSDEAEALARQVEQEGPAVLSAWWAQQLTDLAARAQSGVPTTGPTLRLGRRRPAPEPTDVRLVRGVIAERVAVSTPLDPFLSLKALAGYSGFSVRKLREYLDDPAHPLSCYRVGGKILVRRSEFDGWIAAYRQRRDTQVDAIADDVLRALRERKDVLTP
jgi:hypothetical protein